MVIARSTGSACMVSWGNIQRSIGQRRGLATDAIGLPIFPSDGDVCYARYSVRSTSDTTPDLPQQHLHGHRNNDFERTIIESRQLNTQLSSISESKLGSLELLTRDLHNYSRNLRGNKDPASAKSKRSDYMLKSLTRTTNTPKPSSSVGSMFVSYLKYLFDVLKSLLSSPAVLLHACFLAYFGSSAGAIAFHNRYFLSFGITLHWPLVVLLSLYVAWYRRNTPRDYLGWFCRDFATQPGPVISQTVVFSALLLIFVGPATMGLFLSDSESKSLFEFFASLLRLVRARKTKARLTAVDGEYSATDLDDMLATSDDDSIIYVALAALMMSLIALWFNCMAIFEAWNTQEEGHSFSNRDTVISWNIRPRLKRRRVQPPSPNISRKRDTSPSDQQPPTQQPSSTT